MLSHVRLFATPWTAAHQAPLSMKSSRQEYWRGWPFPSPGDLFDPGTEPTSLKSPALAGGFFTTSATWETLAVHPCKLILATDCLFPSHSEGCRPSGRHPQPPAPSNHRVQAVPSCLMSAPPIGSALQKSWLHLLGPTRGKCWNAPSARSRKEVPCCLPGPLPSDCVFSRRSRTSVWKTPMGTDCWELDASSFSPSSLTSSRSFSPPLLPFPTNLNILINMAPLQGLHAVTAICRGSAGEFSFPF